MLNGAKRIKPSIYRDPGMIYVLQTNCIKVQLEPISIFPADIRHRDCNMCQGHFCQHLTWKKDRPNVQKSHKLVEPCQNATFLLEAVTSWVSINLFTQDLMAIVTWQCDITFQGFLIHTLQKRKGRGRMPCMEIYCVDSVLDNVPIGCHSVTIRYYFGYFWEWAKCLFAEQIFYPSTFWAWNTCKSLLWFRW